MLLEAGLQSFTLEVGARGLIGSRTFRYFVTLGLTTPEARRLCKSLSEIVARCSYAIYLAHSTVVWPHNKDLVKGKRVDDAEAKVSEICLKPAKHSTPAVANVVKLRQNGITKLFHFTDASNVPSIEKHGLMSGASLIENSIDSKMNSDGVSRSLDSQANLEGYVRLSFGPNNPMMYHAIAEKRISQPVMLQIKLEVVSRPGVRFFDSNATRADARQSINPSIVRFDVVRAKKQGDVDPSLQRFYQAEVLVPSPIPPHLIVFPKKPVERFVRVSKHSGVASDLQQERVPSAPYQSVLSEERKDRAPGCNVSAGDRSDNVESTANQASSIGGEVKQQLPKQQQGESCASMSGCLPPEWEKGSRSESTDKTTLSPLVAGSGRQLAADGCLSLPLVSLSDAKRLGVRSAKPVSRHQVVNEDGRLFANQLERMRFGREIELYQAFLSPPPLVVNDAGFCEYGNRCVTNSAGETPCCAMRRCAAHLMLPCNCWVMYSMKKKRIAAKPERNVRKVNETRCDMPTRPPNKACDDCMTGVISCERHMGICGKKVWLGCSWCSRLKCHDAKCLARVCCQPPVKKTALESPKDPNQAVVGPVRTNVNVPVPQKPVKACMPLTMLPAVDAAIEKKDQVERRSYGNFVQMNVYGRYASLADSSETDKANSNMDTGPQTSSSSSPSLSFPSPPPISSFPCADVRSKLSSGGSADATHA